MGCSNTPIVSTWLLELPWYEQKLLGDESRLQAAHATQSRLGLLQVAVPGLEVLGLETMMRRGEIRRPQGEDIERLILVQQLKCLSIAQHLG